MPEDTCKGDDFLEGTFEKASGDHIDQKWDHIDSEESLGSQLWKGGHMEGSSFGAQGPDRHAQKEHTALCRPVGLRCGDNEVRLILSASLSGDLP